MAPVIDSVSFLGIMTFVRGRGELFRDQLGPDEFSGGTICRKLQEGPRDGRTVCAYARHWHLLALASMASEAMDEA